MNTFIACRHRMRFFQHQQTSSESIHESTIERFRIGIEMQVCMLHKGAQNSPCLHPLVDPYSVENWGDFSLYGKIVAQSVEF